MASANREFGAWSTRAGRSAPAASAPRRRRRAGRAFTLIEVLLALALAVVLLGMLGLGVHLYLRAFEAGRDEVEETQLARTILNLIAADLRAAVPRADGGPDSGDPLDDFLFGGESSDSSGGNGSSSSTGGSSSGSSSAGASGPESSASGGGSGESSDTSSAMFETGAIAGVSGLYGDRYHLQVDCLRAAMIDQGEMLLMPEPSGRTIAAASGVRTVVYYVDDGAMNDPLAAPLDEPLEGLDAELSRLDAGPRGLVRQEIDRAVASYAQQQGLVDELSRGAEVVAPEVVAIEFGYFDGTDWWEEWDSDARGGLPVAVEVAIALRDPKTELAVPGGIVASNSAAAIDQLVPSAGLHVYRLLVRIPTAQATGSTATGESSSEAEDSSGGPTETGT